MRYHLKLSSVIAVVLVAIVSAAAAGGGTSSAVSSASGTGRPQIEQARVRLVASSEAHEGDVDVVSVTNSYIFTCGVASCSYYISRKGTKAAADYTALHENALNAAAAGVATGACAATGAGAAAVTVCTTAATAAAGVMMDEVKSAGDRGECLRLHYYFYPILLPATPSANTSGYCQNG